MGEEETEDHYYDRRDAAVQQLIARQPEHLWEYAQWPEHDFLGDLEFERHLYEEWSYRAGNFIINDPWKIAQTLRVLEVRCPERGCYLADAFRFPLQNRGFQYLGIANKVRGESRAAFLTWGVPLDGNFAQQYLPASCRHGNVRLDLFWLLQCALIRTEKFARAKDIWPEEVVRGVRSGTFVPSSAAWRSKRKA